MESAAGNPGSCRAVSKSVLDNRRRKEKQRPGEDDRHHARVIHLQRHVLRLPAVHFAAYDSFSVLHGDFPHALRDRDHSGDHDDQEQYQHHKHHRIHLARSALRRRYKSLPCLRECGRQPSDNANCNDEGYPVADAALGDLIAHPH